MRSHNIIYTLHELHFLMSSEWLRSKTNYSISASLTDISKDSVKDIVVKSNSNSIQDQECVLCTWHRVVCHTLLGEPDGRCFTITAAWHASDSQRSARWPTDLSVADVAPSQWWFFKTHYTVFIMSFTRKTRMLCITKNTMQVNLQLIIDKKSPEFSF